MGGIKETKEAAARLQAWLDADDATHFGQREKDIELVLNHYTKLTKPKVSRKGLYVKGRAYEWELRDDFRASGLPCRRVMQSGGGVEKDDIVLTTKTDGEYRLEAKRIAKVPAYLDNPQCHATLFRRDKGETLVLIPLKRFIRLCGGSA